MKTNRTRSEHLDEAWIAKYRAALNAPPVHQSRFTKTWVSLTSTRNTLFSQLERILSSWTKTKNQRLPAAANEPAAISESQTARCSVERVELSDKNGFKKTAAKPKRARTLLSTQKYRAG
jgi:hypothetical protein